MKKGIYGFKQTKVNQFFLALKRIKKHTSSSMNITKAILTFVLQSEDYPTTAVNRKLHNKYRNYIAENYKECKTSIGLSSRGDTRYDITYIAFLNHGQTVKQGIYPVILYFRKIKKIIFAYGVSATSTSKIEWNWNKIGISTPRTLSELFHNKGWSIYDKYFDSFVHSYYDLDDFVNKFKNIDITNTPYESTFNFELNVNDLINHFNIMFDNINDEGIAKERQNEHRHWLYAPGEKARKWEDCKANGMLLLGWDPIGDFTQYTSIEEISSVLKDEYGSGSSYINDKLAIWQFLNDLKIGDIVYAKNGVSKIIGKGIIVGDYVYDETRDEYKNTRKINWTNIGDWSTDFKLPLKTLTRLNIGDETISKIESLINADMTPSIPSTPFSINSIIEYINETGLLYSPSLIKRFAFSLMAKRFLILSGLAGSGKTQLALAFAKALVEDKEKQMCMVSVGADWTNREPLLGYPNALKTGEYIKPENGVLDLLIEANKPQNASKPFFLILDEMNMSYVERYFADFLSAMESHEAIALWKECNNECESCECEVPERVGLPDNLFIIGTINVDETTYMFSPKVLDRANVIEFKISIDEMTEFLDGIRQVDCSSICSKAAEMGADFVKLANYKDFDNVEATTDTLKAFFTELKSVNAEFGYRSATEIFRFISQVHKNDDTAEKMNKEEVLDAAILQKLLPKLHGSRKKLEPALKGLWKLCFDPSIKDTMQIARENIDKAIYKESADKIFRMYESAYANGFTSFAEA